jgi:hypothetical protein
MAEFIAEYSPPIPRPTKNIHAAKNPKSHDQNEA